MSKKKRIPELRFPEFKNEGEWELRALEDALDYERPDKYIVSDTNYQNEGIPVLTANKSFILGYTNEDYGIYKKLPAIIFDDFTVDSKFVDFPFKVKSSAIKILTPKNKDDLRFAYELISQIDFNAAQHKRYYISEYQKLKLPFPSIKEQQKIASCLSSLDDLIEAHNQKLDLLQDHKKGLMQNLFPQKGEKVPKLRFKEFEKDGEWVEKKLGEIAEIITGNTPNTKETENYGGERLFVSPADISDNRFISQTKTTLTELGFSQTRHIKANSILFVCIGSTIGKVAQNKVECATNQQINSLIPYEGYSNEFLYSSLENSASQISELAGIQAVPIINKSQFSTVKLLFPKLQEQQKIASTLSSLDELITTQAEKIEQLKEHKKGLMQGLFPIID
ncbi:MAG: hypothetical protein ABS44_02860 [Chryseobacterium sp. SCN 40-13]|nr:MAG: hypothetical protein ABS44_02860 [Chryseobacterium sp. SCN 40-13]